MRDVLITAGATRNPIDSMRFISANSSGRTGAILAELLYKSGATVHLMGSPQALLRAPPGITTEGFGSTHDLLARMETWISAHPHAVVIHAAAVGDYEVRAHAGKIPSGEQELSICLVPTPKILDRVRSWATGCFLVSFKAAGPGTDLPSLQLLSHDQLQRTQSDLVFGNVIGKLKSEVVLTQKSCSTIFSNREAGIKALVKEVIAVAGG